MTDANKTSEYGVFVRIIYSDYKAGTAKYIVNPIGSNPKRNKWGYIICEGTYPMIETGTPLVLVGVWNNDLFEVSSYIEESRDRYTSIAYLSSPQFHGIGEKIAEEIVDLFGYDVFNEMTKPDAKEKLLKISRITSKKADMIISNIKSSYVKKELMDYLNSVSGTFVGCENIYKLCKNSALKCLKKDPYKYGLEAGLSFKVCDKIAFNEHLDYFSEERVLGIANYILKNHETAGNCFITLRGFNKMLKVIESKSSYNNELSLFDFIPHLTLEKGFMVEKIGEAYCIYRKEMYFAETSIVRNTRRISSCIKLDKEMPDKYIKEVEDEIGITYGKTQLETFRILDNPGLNIITGGPGTGKTTVINGITKVFKKMYPYKDIILMAPTGRAAKRMSEATGLEAKTIHKALDYRICEGKTTHRTKNDSFSAGLIIVDEFSMVGISLLAVLLDCIQNGSYVIFMGDENQLPSVSAGNALKDIIKSGKIPYYKLETIYRQKQDSNIVYNAEKILEGNTNLKSGKDFELIRAFDETTAINMLNALLIGKDISDPDKFQVLTPLKNGILGARNLNTLIQSKNTNDNVLFEYRGVKYKENDKVMFVVNNYELGYLNGDIYTLSSITENSIFFIKDGKYVEIDKSCIPDMVLSYATTIHKSQGSEYDMVVILLPDTTLLQRNLIFTAITRAKTNVVVIDINNNMSKAIENNEVKARNTSLAYHLCV